MQNLAIITALGTNDVPAVDMARSVDLAVRFLQTPMTFWVIMLAGVVASPWMVRNSTRGAGISRQHLLIHCASAVVFTSAVALFLMIRHRFIEIFAELFSSPEFFLIFPFQLGASSLGAVLLVLAWYSVHPIAWLRPGEAHTAAILKSFTPMLVTMLAFGAMLVISIFIMLV